MKLNRREFIKGLFAAAVALVLPKGSAAKVVEERPADHQLLCSAHTDYADTVARGDIIEGKAPLFELYGAQDSFPTMIKRTAGPGGAIIEGKASSWGVLDAVPEPDGSFEYPYDNIIDAINACDGDGGGKTIFVYNEKSHLKVWS